MSLMAHVVFTLSVRFGGRRIGYVTTGRDSELFPATSQAALVRPLLLWFSLYPFFVLAPHVCDWGDSIGRGVMGGSRSRDLLNMEFWLQLPEKHVFLHIGVQLLQQPLLQLKFMFPLPQPPSAVLFRNQYLNFCCSITNETPAVRAGWCNQLKHGDLATKPG